MYQKFTLIELLLVIAIIAILASLLLPHLGRAQEQAKIGICATNQKQIAAGMRMFAQDNKYRSLPSSINKTDSGLDGIYITPMGLGNGLYEVGMGRLYEEKYITTPNVFYCPSASGYWAEDGSHGWKMGKSTGFVASSFMYEAHYEGANDNEVSRPFRTTDDGQNMFMSDWFINKIGNAFNHDKLYVVTKLDGSARVVKDSGDTIPEISSLTTDFTAHELIWDQLKRLSK